MSPSVFWEFAGGAAGGGAAEACTTCDRHRCLPTASETDSTLRAALESSTAGTFEPAA